MGMGKKKENNSLPEKALAIRQPWATLIALGLKDSENRSWRTKFRGRFCIYASLILGTEMWSMLTKEQLAIIKEKNPELLKKPIDSLPRGEIIGAVTLDSVDDKMISPWDDEYQWHFRLSDAELLEEPIPCRGVLNFFDYKKYLIEEEENNKEKEK